MSVRQSQLKVWMTCSLQAHLKENSPSVYRQNAKASFGTIIHHCLELYNDGMDVEACVQLFRELWANPERLGVRPDYWPKFTTYSGLLEKGPEILRNYHASVMWEKRTIIAQEHRFLVPFGRHEIEGTVDLIELKKAGNGRRTLRIVDYKTNAKQPTKFELLLNTQFTTYIWASMQKEFWVGNGPDFPGMVGGEQLYKDFEKVQRKAIWYHLMGNKGLDAGTRAEEDFARLYRLVEEIERAEKYQVFVPSIGDACTYCDFHDYCGVEIPETEVEIGGQLF